MIVDLHTQIWSSPDQLGPEMADRIRRRQSDQWGQFDGGPPSHERATANVDLALVFGFRADRLEAHVPNEYVAEYVGRAPHRRVGVAGIDPMSSNAAEQFDAAMSMGFVGISVSPACQGFHPAHSDAMVIYEKCLAAGVPLFVSVGDPLPPSAMLEFGRPFLWDEVARAFPKLPIVLNQIGAPWIDETLAMLDKHPHLFADISGVASRPWQLYNTLLTAASMRVMAKLLFASGYPRETPVKMIEALYSVNSYCHGNQLPCIPRAQIRGIIERDATQCLGIELEVTPTTNHSASVDAAAASGGHALAGTGNSNRTEPR